ncbi:MAG: DUF928 domain-containing protein [Microcystaceae cyanobacterium]
MLANFPCCRTLVLASLAVLIGGGIFDPIQPTLASSSSEESSLLVPNRRKPGSSRQLAELPGRRKPGSARDGFAELPGRRKPGSARDGFAELPGRRKPGSARRDIALLLDKNLFGNTATHCTEDIRQITALIPENLLGLTASATPTLYFAVPTLSDSPEMEFVLQDDQRQVIYTAKITLQASGGIMAIQLPASHGLEANQTYHWYLSAICDANYRERDLVVEGLIQRVKDVPNNSASSLEQLSFYQQTNRWQDALHTVIRLYQQEGNSENLEKEWQALVESVNLPEFSSLLQETTVFEAKTESVSFQQPTISHFSNQ